jgi:hypothetical protein
VSGGTSLKWCWFVRRGRGGGLGIPLSNLVSNTNGDVGEEEEEEKERDQRDVPVYPLLNTRNSTAAAQGAR